MGPASMKQFRILWGLLALLACSSSGNKNSPGPQDAGPTCDPTKCFTGNECLSDGTTVECRLVCAAQSDCPFDYKCVQNPNSPKPFCVADTYQLTQGPGQWGASCNPTKGEFNNSDCDTADYFACYGRDPTDAQAFCTLIGNCTTDNDCKGGWTCADVNATPNVTTTKRNYGQTIRACLPRSYCSACIVDLDCPATPEGIPQHCVSDQGGFTFCSAECKQDQNCVHGIFEGDGSGDQRCLPGVQDASGNVVSVCYPRSGVCVGNHSLCSGCFSDDDCVANPPRTANDGYCVQAEYSHELFCTAPSATPCSVGCTVDASTCPTNDQKLVAQCPKSQGNDQYVSCVVDPTQDTTAPRNQCYGLVTKTDPQLGATPVPGCWTPNQ
jgi:hypothetical protein